MRIRRRRVSAASVDDDPNVGGALPAADAPGPSVRPRSPRGGGIGPPGGGVGRPGGGVARNGADGGVALGPLPPGGRIPRRPPDGGPTTGRRPEDPVARTGAGAALGRATTVAPFACAAGSAA